MVKWLDGKIGLHHGALAAAKPATVCGERARAVLGYEGHVTRQDAIDCALQPYKHHLDRAKVEAALARAVRRAAAREEIEAALTPPSTPPA